jgi:hypothetical protein
MKAFGYNTSSEIVFNENQKGFHLISLENSGSSAIHIHVSDNQQIMMEIVTIETENQNIDIRDLNYGSIVSPSELSDEENDFLIRKMDSFCELHPKITEELKKRGIVFNAKNHKKTDIKYCRKIQLTDTFGKVIESNNRFINDEQRYKSSTKKKKLLALNNP